MQIKSAKYTGGEFKMVKDLVSIEDSLLISSQMANSLLMLDQHEKMLKKAQSDLESQKSGDSSAPKPASTDERTTDRQQEAPKQANTKAAQLQ